MKVTLLGAMIFAIVIFLTTLLVCQHFLVPNTFVPGLGSGEFEEPSAWDVFQFNASFFYGLMTGSVTGAPIYITVILWVCTFIVVICTYMLIRGVG